MPTFISLGKLTDQGMKEIHRLPQGVRQTFAQAEQQGVRLVGYYVTEGRYDVVVIVEAENERAALAGLFSANRDGLVRTETLRAHSLDEAEGIIQDMR